ncbi:MAG TPA: hypothetical protein VMQ67_11895, partial [Candidatus Saccharimonadales bacterium]|nr:hypothetical protein [Candidatus Saccharimonadales bacterium]
MITPIVGTAVSRRRFLLTGGAALALPHLIAGCATSRKPPSQQIAVGIIGSGGQGTNNTNSFLDHSDCRVVAACDVDKVHLDDLVGVVNKRYNNKDCKPYHDFRELLA